MESKIRRGVVDDRISDLPDPILGKIVSCLPIKNAVATSVLSTRWKNLFPAELPVINVDLCDTQLLNPTTGNEPRDYIIPTSFINFVDKLLRDVPCIDLFSLTLDNFLYEREFVGTSKSWITWICAAVRLGAKEIRLDCYLQNTEDVFDAINGCATLRRLELKGKLDDDELIFYIKPSFSLPVLTTLDLFRVAFHDDYYLEDGEECTLAIFINGCPALRELSMTDCDLQGFIDISIIAPVLKTLRIHNSLEGNRLTINTPNLELLLLMNNRVANNYCIYPFNSLGLGHIDDQPWYYQCAGDLLFDCRKTRHDLYVSLSYIEYLPHANMRLRGFQNLTRLSLHSVRSTGWNALACILNNAPNLVELKFEENFVRSNMGFADFERLVPSPPTCLELNIRTIAFQHFDENGDVKKLLDYFVKNGKVLENIVLNNVTLPIKR